MGWVVHAARMGEKIDKGQEFEYKNLHPWKFTGKLFKVVV
jgi:hypothetical protein